MSFLFFGVEDGINIGTAASAVSYPAPWLGRLLVVSLLVMLNLPAIFTGATGMDQYGFFTLGPVADRPWPLVLSIALSTSTAGIGYLAYRLLRLRRTWFSGSIRYGAYHRNAVLFGVPVGIAFAPSFFLAGYNDKPIMVAMAGIMATCLCITAALNDRETRLDAAMARLWFVACIAFILVFLVLSMSAMWILYFVDHSPSVGNFFWSWDFAWSDLGYPAEEFSQRRRNGLLAFTLMGSCYMIVALGGSLLGGILGWARPGMEKAHSPEPPDGGLASASGPLPDWLNGGEDTPQDAPEFVVVLNGEEAAQISRSRYQYLLANKDRLLPGFRLLVDKASGAALARTGGRWRKIPFRGRRKGPFQLLCIYAPHPGKRFTVGELETLLAMELPDRVDLNVNDFFSQLQRKPLVPVERDTDGSYIPASVRVCFLDYLPEFSDNGSSAWDTPMTDPSSMEK